MAAVKMGVSRGQYIKLERGERKLTERTIRLAARGFEVDEAAVIAERLMVPVIGYVGAGALASFFADAQDFGEFDYVPAPDGSTGTTVAVEIRGDSLGSIFDRWLVFYDDVKSPVTSDQLGRLCVVALPSDQVLVKKIRKSKAGENLYNLYGTFGDPIEDTPVLWAARVKQMVPR